MPSRNEYQKPAGVEKPCRCGHVGTRRMVSKNMNIKTSLIIDEPIYKGNAVLNANK
jgi:hypothetical protein